MSLFNYLKQLPWQQHSANLKVNWELCSCKISLLFIKIYLSLLKNSFIILQLSHIISTVWIFLLISDPFFFLYHMDKICIPVSLLNVCCFRGLLFFSLFSFSISVHFNCVLNPEVLHFNFDLQHFTRLKTEDFFFFSSFLIFRSQL